MAKRNRLRRRTEREYCASDLGNDDDLLTDVFIDTALGFETHKMNPAYKRAVINRTLLEIVMLRLSWEASIQNAFHRLFGGYYAQKQDITDSNTSSTHSLASETTSLDTNLNKTALQSCAMQTRNLQRIYTPQELPATLSTDDSKSDQNNTYASTRQNLGRQSSKGRLHARAFETTHLYYQDSEDRQEVLSPDSGVDIQEISSIVQNNSALQSWESHVCTSNTKNSSRGCVVLESAVPVARVFDPMFKEHAFRYDKTCHCPNQVY